MHFERVFLRVGRGVDRDLLQRFQGSDRRGVDGDVAQRRGQHVSAGQSQAAHRHAVHRAEPLACLPKASA